LISYGDLGAQGPQLGVDAHDAIDGDDSFVIVRRFFRF